MTQDTHPSAADILNSFKDSQTARKLLQKISAHTAPLNLMEVCGTHTVAVLRTGIKSGLPSNIRLISGPGCPVCVTPQEIIEKAIGLARRSDTVLFCFGDMIRVPGVSSSLEAIQTAKTAAVRIMYSPIEALQFAQQFPDKKVVLFGVGFETTIPVFASVVLRARKEQISNLYVLPNFKLVPPAIAALLDSRDVAIDGFMLPGHVSAVIGAEAYEFMGRDYGVTGVITGFEVVDILSGISCLLDMIAAGETGIENRYGRFVGPGGNKKALSCMNTVFKKADTAWRGMGTIDLSGLAFREEFADFDAQQLVDFEVPLAADPPGCRCGDVIKGVCSPPDCGLFKTGCTPQQPVGPCMVSSEGTCAAYYKYGG